ncbi:hypothetical protein [Streptomyces sp. NBC_01767]|nr:hypothetical protein [Streptomyces sp. NBC_01767]MCX4393272.1 hypothetical protein [Streptomyces sp. NBC_01767]
MTTHAQLLAFSSPLWALLTVLFSVALTHPEPQVRARAEQLLAIFFRAR